MDNIQDIHGYVRSMSTTLLDKCWWLDKIPDTIDTIVDYGCAQGDLAIFVDSICPGRFKYIGIDNSPEMLALASHNHYLHFGKDSDFYSELPGIASKCDTNKSVLVLNSVTHEIFSYLTKGERRALFAEMFGAGFSCIAIRDMYMPSIDECSIDVDAALAAILNSPYAGMWKEFNDHINNHPRENGCWGSVALRMTEFFMKYRYAGNWQREMRETYFWDWLPCILDECEAAVSYKLAFTDRFYIPFIRDKVLTDFGVDFPVKTHRKVLLTK